MKKENYLKICPKCGSVNITQWVKEEKLLCHCKDCYYGYLSGALFPEVEESMVGEFRKNLIKQKK